MRFASAFVRAEILAAMGLSAVVLGSFSGCAKGEVRTGDSGDSGDTDGPVVPPDDYGTCDSEVVDALAFYELDENGFPPRGPVLYCADNFEDVDTCLASTDDDFSLMATDFSTTYSGDDQGFDMYRVCGPMWLDGSCCHQVEISEWIAGRPLRVMGEVRVARAVGTSDWCDSIDVRPVPESLRAFLGKHWVAQGLAEHASVASFARFMVQLVHIGAPADLLASANRAVADELMHARACFSLAAGYGGAPVGPGPLDTSDCLASEVDPEAVLRETLLDGCINETLAAVEAAHLSKQVDDPTLKSVLESIARDESRHAALAWRTVRWLVSENPSRMAIVHEVIATEHARLLEASLGEKTRSLEAYGVLGPRERQVLARHAFDAVILPLVPMAGESVDSQGLVAEAVGAACDHA